MNRHSPKPCAVALAAFLVSLASPAAHAAFGGAGGLGDCASFTTCTAALASNSFGYASYHFDPTPSYPTPSGFSAGLNVFTDSQAGQTTAVQRAAVGSLCVNCTSSNTFLSSAFAVSQSDFGTHRVDTGTSVGAQGTDIIASSTQAKVAIQTFAEAGSVWRDVWRFSADGHFSATIAIDGQASAASSNGFFPSTYQHTLATPSGDWFYDLDVWDVDHLSQDADGFLAPTLVARLRDRSGNAESRPSFDSKLALDFDVLAGVSYVVVAELRANARNGRSIDLFHTARLDDVAWTGPSAMFTLSGHDYAASATPVPEPGTWALLLGGLGVTGLLARRRRRS